MMASSSYSLAFYVTILVKISIITHCYSSSCPPQKHAALFIFGDSVFDAGNNNYISTSAFAQANFPPYGETFFRYPNGRFSDGRVIPDFIAEFAGLPIIPPYLHPGYRDGYIYGVNFASGAAGALVETRQGLAIDLKTQVRYFKEVRQILRQKLGDSEAKALVSKAVYIFSIGGNDYSAPFMQNPRVPLPYSPQELVNLVIGNLTTVIKDIYKEGGRKFGLPNLPPYGCFPILKILVNGSTNACLEEVLELVRLHNKALPKTFQKLEKQLKGFKYSITDFYNEFSKVLKYPSNFGFKEANVACCGGGSYRGDFSCGGKRGIEEYQLCKNVSEFVFFDSAHATDRTNHHFAQLMWSGNHTFSWPHNVQKLFEI